MRAVFEVLQVGFEDNLRNLIVGDHFDIWGYITTSQHGRWRFAPAVIFVSESSPSDKGQISLSKTGYISSIKSL